MEPLKKNEKLFISKNPQKNGTFYTKINNNNKQTDINTNKWSTRKRYIYILNVKYRYKINTYVLNAENVGEFFKEMTSMKYFSKMIKLLFPNSVYLFSI